MSIKKEQQMIKDSFARLSVLQTLCDIGSEGCRFISLFITSPYGTSFNKFQKDWIDGKTTGSMMPYKERERWNKERKRFYSLLHHLQKEGLVAKTKKDAFTITPKGRKRKRSYEERDRMNTIYIRESTNKTILIIFDVPERKARYRNWLRSTLKELEYEMVQKSVWKGTNAIPKDLLEDIEYFGLTPYIEILEAVQLGSLKKIEPHQGLYVQSGGNRAFFRHAWHRNQ